MSDPQSHEPIPSQSPRPAPPPLPPAGQFAPPPPMAGGPPPGGGGPRPVLPVSLYPDPYAPYWAPPPAPPENPRAKTLILWSRILGWGGIAVLFLGTLVGAVLMSGPRGDPTVMIVCGIGGFASAVVGAILGQIGRAMQGRVV